MNRNKNRRARHAAVLLLLALTLLPLLASCAEKGQTGADGGTSAANTAPETTSGTTTAAETQPSREPLDLPEADYDGYDFRILSMFSTTMGGWAQPGAHYWSDFGYNEERAGEPINDAVHARNMEIEEKYDVVIHMTEVASVKTEAQKFISAGDDSYDVITPLMNDSFGMAQSGFLVNLYDIPHLQLGKPWWDDVLRRDLGMGGRLYIASGDISMEDEEYNHVTLFNKGMVEKFSLKNPYEAVRDGAFTLDFMYESGKAVTFDVDGDGVLGPKDSFGLGTDYTDAEVFLIASGENIARLDENGRPSITLLNERSASVMDKINAQFNDETYMIWATVILEKYGIKANWSELNVMLFDGRLLYRVANIYNIKQYREMIDDFGMLPLPKYDEQQEHYRTFISSHAATAVSVPATNTDHARTGLLLEALAYASESVRSAYYDVTLTSKYARDRESLEILDLIFASRSFDIGKVFGWGGFTNVINNSVKNNGGFVSAVEANLTAAQEAMEKSYASFMEDVSR